MLEKTIFIKDIDAARDFNRKISGINCDIDLIPIYKRRHIVDAKSVMGLFTLDLSRPLILKAYTNDPAVIEELDKAIYDLSCENI